MKQKQTKRWDLIKLTNNCTAKKKKKKHKQNEKTAYGMGENICKWYDQQGIDFQNVQTAHITQQQQNKQFNEKKWAEDLNRYFSKKTTDG